ncbi:uncharacterized protein LOC116348391 isoform X2 [Contarinia nasturtii]|uniref:uncharacterized protein LOC116348391 isoform X2 n=1 Tax=Contarinia nasturtii TaxID=265458 RepID=UPI0012D41A80|nr:uncharacterized protein LOC116348391 isoform X2 [Contarinia nasturtii]
MRPAVNSVINSAVRQSINVSIQNESAPMTEKITNFDIHRANFIWPEDPEEELPVKFNQRFQHRRLHMSAMVPFGVMLVLSTIIFIMIIFRRWPGVVSGIVAGCLTFISIYLLLLTLKEEVLVYE